MNNFYVIKLGYFKVKAKFVGLAPGPGVDFINILCAAFTLVDPKSVKKIDNLTVFLRTWDLG